MPSGKACFLEGFTAPLIGLTSAEGIWPCSFND